MWSKILLLICQADIRNPLRYLHDSVKVFRSSSDYLKKRAKCISYSFTILMNS